jgi:hypothetical protein
MAVGCSVRGGAGVTVAQSLQARAPNMAGVRTVVFEELAVECGRIVGEVPVVGRAEGGMGVR